MQPPKALQDLMSPLINRNISISQDTPEQKLARIKAKYGLTHGKGKKKKQKNKKK